MRGSLSRAVLLQARGPDRSWRSSRRSAPLMAAEDDDPAQAEEKPLTTPEPPQEKTIFGGIPPSNPIGAAIDTVVSGVRHA